MRYAPTTRVAAIFIGLCLSLSGACSSPTAASNIGTEQANELATSLAVCSPESIRAAVSTTTLQRQQIIERGLTWVEQQVPYSQSSFMGPESYRQDCSGLVSMCWSLGRPGQTTSTIEQYAQQIDWANVLPGDALNYAGKHVMLFAGWLDDQQTRFCTIEEYGPNGVPALTKVHERGDSYVQSFKLIRFGGLMDNGLQNGSVSSPWSDSSSTGNQLPSYLDGSGLSGTPSTSCSTNTLEWYVQCPNAGFPATSDNGANFSEPVLDQPNYNQCVVNGQTLLSGSCIFLTDGYSDSGSWSYCDDNGQMRPVVGFKCVNVVQ